MRSLRVFLCFFSLFLLSCQFSSKEKEQIDAALLAYETGRFEESVDLYKNLLADGVRNGALHYNLASAYFRSGQKAEAIACLLRARDYLPRDADVQANLDFILGQIENKLEAVRPDTFWQKVFWKSDVLSSYELIWAFLGFVCLCVWFMTGFFIGGMRRVFTGLALTVLGALLTGSLLLKKNSDFGRWQVLSSPSETVYSSPNKISGSSLFELKQGAPVFVLRTSGPTSMIQISDGKQGWVETKNLTSCSSSP